jgi:hypothetical protein
MKVIIILVLAFTFSMSVQAGVQFLPGSSLGDQAQYAVSGFMNKHCPHTIANEVSTKTYIDRVDQGFNDYYRTTIIKADNYEVIFEFIEWSGSNPYSLELIDVRTIPAGQCNK